MVPFIPDEPAGVPLDGRNEPGGRPGAAGRSLAPRPGVSRVASETGRFLEEIESRKGSLLGRPFLRQGEVEAAREELRAGVLDTPDALREAAERILRGESAEDPSLDGL